MRPASDRNSDRPPVACSPNPSPPCSKYGELLRHSGEAPVAVRRCETVEEVLRESDVSALGAGRGEGRGAVSLAGRVLGLGLVLVRGWFWSERAW